MGKRRKKFHNYQKAHHTPVSQPSQPTTVVQQPIEKPLVDRSSAAYQAHQAEYRNITHDLIRVAIINTFFLLVVIALYFANKSNPFLDSWLDKLF